MSSTFSSCAFLHWINAVFNSLGILSVQLQLKYIRFLETLEFDLLAF